VTIAATGARRATAVPRDGEVFERLEIERAERSPGRYAGGAVGPESRSEERSEENIRNPPSKARRELPRKVCGSRLGDRHRDPA